MKGDEGRRTLRGAACVVLAATWALAGPACREDSGADADGASAAGGANADAGTIPAGGASGAGGGPGSGGASGSGGSPADAGACEEFVMPGDCAIPDGAVLPGELRCTGLYADWPTRTLRCGVEAYAPAYQLWADGAGKQRYVWLPPGQAVDASDPDDFVFPVGTRFWKEFHVGPEGQQRLGETRYLLKVKGGWLYTTYVWSEDGTAATQTNGGVENLLGTGHGVPTREQCKTCHSGRPDYILGWDFLMLGQGATGLTASKLAERGQLADFPPALLDSAIPGDEVERRALSYLHANCGVSCHNQTPNAEGRPSGLYLRLEIAELDSVLATDAATSGINRLPSPNADYGDLARPDGDFYDFRPLDGERSLALARTAYRGSVTAMPPIGTHRVDQEGVAALRAWILSMTEERGYPPPAP